MNKYTVVLLYPEHATGNFGKDVYIDAAKASDAYEATKKVQQHAEDANTNGDEVLVEADEMEPIAVFRGDCTLELDATNFED